MLPASSRRGVVLWPLRGSGGASPVALGVTSPHTPRLESLEYVLNSRVCSVLTFTGGPLPYSPPKT